jgi:hypothetical protein
MYSLTYVKRGKLYRVKKGYRYGVGSRMEGGGVRNKKIAPDLLIVCLPLISGR